MPYPTTICHYLDRAKIDLVKGETFTFEAQEFTGYSAVTNNMKEANDAYSKVKALHMNARHVMCGARIPGNELYLNEGYEDDGEHGGGKFMLDLLRSNEIEYRAVFVARVYNGTHIKEQRWTEIEKAVMSAVNRSAMNKFTGQHQLMWSNGGYSDKRGHGRGYG